MSNNYFHCVVDGCDSKFKRKSGLKQHKADIHDIGVKWFHCDVDGCDSKFKQKGHLKQHKEYVHDIGVKWFHCDVDGCDSKFKRKGSLKRHKADAHDIGVKWFYCDVEGCDSKFKRKSGLKRHKADVHDIGVKWFHCVVDGCDSKFKRKSSLKLHKEYVHDISVKWFHCDVDGCDSKFKQKSSLKLHKEYVHDIGIHKCEFCYYNRNSHISHIDHTGTYKICRKCYKKATGKESRIEHIWSDYIDKELGTEFLTSSDKSLKSNGGCSLYRPDKLYIGAEKVEIDECDEYQHKRENGNYSCDEKRISDIYDENGIKGKDLVVIRWNPDNYKVPPGYTKKKRKERLRLFVELKKKLRAKKQKDKIHIYYMFYDIDNPRISKKIPHTMIYDETDIHKI